jgi:hypothetical protein
MPSPSQVLSCTQDPSSIYRSTRPRRLVDRKPKAILRRRVVQHLREVEQRHQGKPCRSIRLYINRCNSGTPPDKPLCSCVLFGEEDYFLDEEQKTDGPTNGFRIVVFYYDADDYILEESDNHPLGDSDGTDNNNDSKEDKNSTYERE